ncbi:MAG TPA: hypothetical protein VGX92_09205 [Pyrinomonadaceae bacterium]|jgi:hypothetical protein|nr:hypothetical protein [Pyrinomonadaceae bacterium]
MPDESDIPPSTTALPDDSGESVPSGEAASSDIDPELEDVARTEHEYVRKRLGEELGRTPTEDEMDEWLRQHTEGH